MLKIIYIELKFTTVQFIKSLWKQKIAMRKFKHKPSDAKPQGVMNLLHRN